MCLGIPGKVLAVEEVDGTMMGRVDFDGIIKDVCLAYVPDIAVGEYAIIHVGFAITRLDEASALESLALMQQMGVLDEELDPRAAEAAAAAQAGPALAEDREATP